MLRKRHSTSWTQGRNRAPRIACTRLMHSFRRMFCLLVRDTLRDSPFRWFRRLSEAGVAGKFEEEAAGKVEAAAAAESIELSAAAVGGTELTAVTQAETAEVGEVARTEEEAVAA